MVDRQPLLRLHGRVAARGNRSQSRRRGKKRERVTSGEHGNWTFLKREGKRFTSDDESKFQPIWRKWRWVFVREAKVANLVRHYTSTKRALQIELRNSQSLKEIPHLWLTDINFSNIGIKSKIHLLLLSHDNYYLRDLRGNDLMELVLKLECTCRFEREARTNKTRVSSSSSSSKTKAKMVGGDNPVPRRVSMPEVGP